MGKHYEFDKVTRRFILVTRSTWKVARKVLGYFIASVSLALLYYAIVSLFVSSDAEKRLARENALFKEAYPQMHAEEQLIADVVEGLEAKDGRIYEEVFHSPAPDVDPLGQSDFFNATDSIPSRFLVEYAETKVRASEASAAKVEDNFRKIYDICMEKGKVDIPMHLPLRGMHYAQVGASVGQKVHPYLKVEAEHRGIDLVATQGEPVRATAAGTVTSAYRSHSGDGNVVEIAHGGGYVTRYCHLGDVWVVPGQWVKVGARIGTVGLSGTSFAPHLHYEIRRDTVCVDPVHYFFASVHPADYSNMIYMAAHTRQSLD